MCARASKATSAQARHRESSLELDGRARTVEGCVWRGEWGRSGPGTTIANVSPKHHNAIMHNDDGRSTGIMLIPKAGYPHALLAAGLAITASHHDVCRDETHLKPVIASEPCPIQGQRTALSCIIMAGLMPTFVKLSERRPGD
eukprot:2663514-Rhodomonas_salina.6